MHQAGDHQAADGIIRHEGIQRLQDNEQCHHDAAEPDNPVMPPGFPCCFCCNIEGVGGCQEEEQYLQAQGDVPAMTRVVYLIRIIREEERVKKVYGQSRQLKEKNQAPGKGQDFAELVFPPQVEYGETAPEQNSEGHEQEIQHRIRIDQRNYMPVIEQPP